MKIVIIGAGEIGMAIGHLLKRSFSNPEILYYDKNPDLAFGKCQLSSILPGANFCFFCVNSWFLTDAISEVKPYLDSDAVLLFLSKGIEKNSLRTVDEIIGASLESQKVALLSGPMLAEELENDLGGVATVATKQKSTYAHLENLFEGTELKLEYCSDLKGVALSGVLKNIYTLALGLADAYNLSHNLTGYMVEKSVREMRIVVEKLGGNKNTIFLAAGLADYMATGFSDQSINHMAGIQLWQKCQLNENAEGVVSLKPLVQKLEGVLDITTLPILNMLISIVNKPDLARQYFSSFIREQL